jgi:hypothetical protein
LRARILTPRGLAVIAAVLAILLLTLTPSGIRPPLPFSYEIGGERRWLSDGILNLCLFIPLGLTIGWESRSPWPAVFCGLLLSTAVELAQTMVPGRDPALSDIIFNSLGAMVGAVIARNPRTWYAPGEMASRILTAASILTAALVMTGTAVLLSPSGSSCAPARAGADLRLECTSRADQFGLDQPEYWLRGAFNAKAEVPSLSVRPDRAKWRVIRGMNTIATLGPTVGQGWALLAYPNEIGRRWSPLLNGAWLAALLIPIGFWSWRTTRLIALAACVALLALIPVVIGVAFSGPVEWLGALIGFTLGAGLSSRMLVTGHQSRTPEKRLGGKSC